MRLWLFITVLLTVTVLATETFAKKTKSNEVESSKSVREKHGRKVTDAGNNDKTKEGDANGERRHLKEHGKAKKRKGGHSEERSFENDFDGSKDSHRATKSKNKRTKKSEEVEEQRTRPTNTAESTREKERHAKDKYKRAVPNAKNKNDKERSSEVGKEKSSRNAASDSSSKKSLKVVVENTEKLTDGGDVNAENNKNRKKPKSSKSSRDIDGTVNEKLKKSKHDKKKKRKNRVPKDQEKSFLEKVEEERNVEDPNVPADAEEMKEEPRKISKESRGRKKRRVEPEAEQELEEESRVEEEALVAAVDRKERDECEQCENLREDTESCVREENFVEEDDGASAED